MSAVTTTPALHLAAADALVGLLPTSAPLRAVSVAKAGQGARLNSAVVASFVGSVSADLAIVLDDVDALAEAAAEGSTLVSVTDVLQPALEAAGSTLGAGVLGEVRTEDASALFADEDSLVFELVSEAGASGWFAIRVRHNRVERAAEGSVLGKLGRINNVEMALTVEIGRTRMSVRDVLAIEPGAVIELDRSAVSPADVLLNGRLIAHGEIVVVDQDYAVRITKILDASEDLD